MKPSLQFSIPFLGYEQEEGPPSFRYIFFELPFPSFPHVFPEPGFFVANGWCNGKGEFEQRMQILLPDRETVLVDTGPQPFNLTEAETPFMAVNLFKELEFPAPGTYWFRVMLDGQITLEHPLVIRQAEAAAGQDTSEAKGAQKESKPKDSPQGAPKNLQID